MAKQPRKAPSIWGKFKNSAQAFFKGKPEAIVNTIANDAEQYASFLINDNLSSYTSNDDVFTRDAKYLRYQAMEQDGIISSALAITVTAALGGHETTGDVVFIEKSPKATAAQSKLIEDLQAHLQPMLNAIVYSVAYVGSTYGDAFARIYARAGEGVQSIGFNESTHPSRIIAYEKATSTVGYYLRGSTKSLLKGQQPVLNAMQMARFKMPRTVLEDDYTTLSFRKKQMRFDRLLQDDIEQAPILPASVGGSLMTGGVERAYDNFSLSLTGMTMQRIIDSIDESIMTYAIDGDKQRRADFKQSLIGMFTRSKQIADTIVNGSESDKRAALLKKHRHFVPVSLDGRQNLTDTGLGGSKRSNGAISVEDVMTNARLLAGALGVDLSLLGFADQLAGGLGEGGFFRVSAQVAERARIIRSALADFVEQIIEIHLLAKYGLYLAPQDRFWRVNFFGSISAFEAEQRETIGNAMTAGATLVQTIQMMKDAGFTSEAMALLLTKQMLVDEELAKAYATFKAEPQPQES